MQSKTFSLNAQKSTSVNICSFYLTLSLNVRYQIMSFNKLHIDRRFEVQMKFYVPHLSMASLWFSGSTSSIPFTPHFHTEEPSCALSGFDGRGDETLSPGLNWSDSIPDYHAVAQTWSVDVLQSGFCSNLSDKWLSHICCSEIRLVDQMNDTYLEQRPLRLLTLQHLDSASTFNDTSR